MFNDLPQYFGRQTFILDKIKFRHLDGWYEGKGYLFWDFDKGLKIEAFVKRKGKPLTGSFSDKTRVILKSEYTTIRLKPRNAKWAIVLKVPLADRLFDILGQNQLSISVPHVIFCNGIFSNPRERKRLGLDSSRMNGEAFFQTSRKHILPEPIAYEIKIGGDDFRKGSNRIAFHLKKGNNFSVTGYCISDTCIKVEFDINKKEIGSFRPWLDALGFSLSFYYGERIELLHTKFGDYRNEFIEYRKLDVVKSLGAIKPFDDVLAIDSQSIVNLANFLSRKSVEAEVCCKMYLQIVEAAQQKSWAARELLLATILEAALRTLNNKPFVPGNSQDSSVISQGLKDFFNTKILNSITDEQYKRDWKKVRKNVEGFHEKLRHRNAHPDWLTGERGAWSDGELEGAFYMQRFLTRFYGYMILALAGCKNLQPMFPESPEQQREADNTSNLGKIGPSPQLLQSQTLTWL